MKLVQENRTVWPNTDTSVTEKLWQYELTLSKADTLLCRLTERPQHLSTDILINEIIKYNTETKNTAL